MNKYASEKHSQLPRKLPPHGFVESSLPFRVIRCQSTSEARFSECLALLAVKGLQVVETCGSFHMQQKEAQVKSLGVLRTCVRESRNHFAVSFSALPRASLEDII